MKLRIFATMMILFLAGCTQIDTGNVGVEKAFGKINPEPKVPGVYAAVFDSIYEVSTKEVSFPINDLSPKSKDNLTLKDLDLDIYFKASPAKIPGLYIKYQGDYVLHSQIVEGGNDVGIVGYNRVLRAAREAVYDAVSQFEATTMHTKRAEISEAIRKNLQRELETSDPNTFTVTSINVRNLMTDPAIEKAIQARAATDQEIARAQKQIELAKAQAQIRIEGARGQAEANRILGESLSGNVMQLRMAELQRDTIVQSAKAGNTVISGNVTPMIVAGQN
jgi:prohibitin 1